MSQWDFGYGREPTEHHEPQYPQQAPQVYPEQQGPEYPYEQDSSTRTAVSRRKPQYQYPQGAGPQYRTAVSPDQRYEPRRRRTAASHAADRSIRPRQRRLTRTRRIRITRTRHAAAGGTRRTGLLSRPGGLARQRRLAGGRWVPGRRRAL